MHSGFPTDPSPYLMFSTFIQNPKLKSLELERLPEVQPTRKKHFRHSPRFIIFSSSNFRPTTTLSPFYSSLSPKPTTFFWLTQLFERICATTPAYLANPHNVVAHTVHFYRARIDRHS
ncbi:hypothetical protein F9C07_820 [Aspergillus flavus]|uniref:Uncharacterized protein n=3 Tax=Aspergillus subgen. Circumdati TaxID=2720871 RepID=A0A7U2QX07_ASPFN|nr:unnamed protein product [Aspergillus oryzae RIB40]EIT80157.1 hypothetical protein Ao3042_03502 [Aspergillus oryzae 3.042]KDE81554.1 hypothetical protein AO1008_08217 [Aspergillus oryzae 100-8]QRD87839.1 hypothetical protein F9C07_820 [Aspergillus flavus]BAE55808.1 unnamed protein product [Aspergillus oryzae RIB40]|eukprot:EIT80157.1 hypothetical protein Ao3042_03502 [Aspergillus oryzae 3.042]